MTATEEPPVKEQAAKPVNGALHSTDHAIRPSPKVAFPVRLEPGVLVGKPAIFIKCDWPLPDGRMATYTIDIVEPDNELVATQSMPWGYKLIEAHALFHKLQAQVDGLMKERDDLLVENRLMAGELKRLRGLADDLKGKAAVREKEGKK